MTNSTSSATYSATSGTALVTVASTISEGAFGGTPAAVPGTVLAEKYDTGGQGVAYNVTTVNGTDNSYRSDGVDLETTSAPGGGNDLGWTATSQWFRYTVNVATAGTYTVAFEIASPSGLSDAFHLANASGTNLSGSVNVPSSGGWQTWTTVTATVTLPAGQQVLTLDQDNAGWNIYSMAFALATPPSLPSVPQIQTPTVGEGTVLLNWGASTGTTPVTYTIYRGAASGSEVQIATGITTASYSDAGLANDASYYYKVSATNSIGTSAESTEVAATTLKVVLQIDAGGSGASPYLSDEDFNTGNEFSSSSTISTAGVTSPAPQAVYQTVRWASSFLYTISGLTAGSSYTVRLHFAELTWTVTGERVFNVAINGTAVLSDFDVFAAAGGELKAVVKQFTASANSSGQIVISFTQGTADNPEIAGIEILDAGSGTTPASKAP